MHAVVLTAHGGPDVLECTDHPDPVPGPGQVVVGLRAAALNWHDCLLRQGAYPAYPVPIVPGSDGAGVRRDTGEEVLILPSLRWGADERAPGPDWEILGDKTDGTYAELVCVPEECVFPKPAGWSWQEAAALPLAGLTAQRALFSRGGLKPGETVLILGAGGGVATIAISLAHAAGARVLVTSSADEKIAHAVSLGATGGVRYDRDGWVEEVRAQAGVDGIDLVVDSVGSTWAEALTALRPGGRLVSFGATGSAEAQVDVRRFYFSQQTVLGSTMGSPRDFADLLAAIAAGPSWRPAIDSAWPLAEAAAAHAAMERREHTGKLVLEIA